LTREGFLGYVIEVVSKGEMINRRLKLAHSKNTKKSLGFVLVAGSQEVIDLLERRGVSRISVLRIRYQGKTLELNNGYLVTAEMAKEVCQLCYEELCRCSDKLAAPLILCRPLTTRRGILKAMPLRREQLPIKIPKRLVA
jgi:hypothetical protein